MNVDANFTEPFLVRKATSDVYMRVTDMLIGASNGCDPHVVSDKVPRRR